MGEKTLIRQLPRASTLDEIRALMTAPVNTPPKYQRVERRAIRLPRATPLVVKRETTP